MKTMLKVVPLALAALAAQAASAVEKLENGKKKYAFEIMELAKEISEN